MEGDDGAQLSDGRVTAELRERAIYRGSAELGRGNPENWLDRLLDSLPLIVICRLVLFLISYSELSRGRSVSTDAPSTNCFTPTDFR